MNYYGVHQSLSISHHGILGMKWGVRRFQNKNGSLTSAGKKRYAGKSRKQGLKLTDRQKRAIKIGAAVAITGLAAYGGYKLYKSGLLDNSSTTDILGAPEGSKSSFELTNDNIQSCAVDVNPTKSRTNCGSCATATLQNMIDGPGTYQALSEPPEHMRIVKSDGSLGKGYDPDKLIECYQGASWTKMPDNLGNRRNISRELESTMLSYGDGAKGIFYFERMVGNKPGHYFTFAVLDGKINVVESQPAKEGIVWNTNFYDNVGHLADPMYDVKVARLDTHPLKPERANDLFKKRS